MLGTHCSSSALEHAREALQREVGLCDPLHDPLEDALKRGKKYAVDPLITRTAAYVNDKMPSPNDVEEGAPLLSEDGQSISDLA
jgi:hypothetical protein